MYSPFITNFPAQYLRNKNKFAQRPLTRPATKTIKTNWELCYKWASLKTKNRGYINQQDRGEFFGWKGYGLMDDQGQKLASGNYESLRTARCTKTETKSHFETKKN